MMEKTEQPVPPPCPPLCVPMNVSQKRSVKFRVSGDDYQLPNAKDELKRAFKFAGLVVPDRRHREELVQAEPSNVPMEIHRENQSVLLCHYQQVHPNIQDGPQCGLVAISMASQLLCERTLEVSGIFEHCKNMGWTRNGEMFSAQAMCDAAREMCGCQAYLLEDVRQRRDILIQHLLHGNPVLFPYDADRNHGPGQRGGCAAHWAVLTGTVINVAGIPESLLEETYEQDKETGHIYCIKENRKLDLADVENFKLNDVYVCTRQGKSNYMRLWKLDDMISSSCQMKNIGKDVLETIGEEILPKTFISLEHDLANKAVCLIKNKT